MLLSTRTTAATAVVAILSAVGLASCQVGTSGTAIEETGPPIPLVETVDLEVPAEMLPVTPGVAVFGEIVPGVEGLPSLVGGSVRAPGEGARPVVWSSQDGAAWEERDVVEDFDGSFSGSFAGSETLSAMAGSAWRDGTRTSILWTSIDRSSWSEVPLPESFGATHIVDSIDVTGDTIVGTGTDVDGRAEGFLVSPEETVAFDLPSPGEGKVLGVVSLVADGDVIVLVARPGDHGVPEPIVSFRSDDRGKSWRDAVDLAPKTAVASGVVWTGTGFVMTGAVQGRSAQGHPLRPAAWSSVDGAAWVLEDVPAPSDDSPFAFQDGTDVQLGSPQAVSGLVNSMASNDRSLESGVYQRSAEGTWTLNGLSTRGASPGQGGRAVGLDDGTLLGVISGAGEVRLGRLGGTEWTEGVTLAPREDLFAPSAIVSLHGGPSAILERAVFTSDEAWWRASREIRLAAIEAGVLRETSSDPARIADLGSVIRAEDAGSEVVLGAFFPEDGASLTVEGWFRPAPDADWTPVTGFPSDGRTFFSTVVRTTVGWTAVGTSTPNDPNHATRHATSWSSLDGVTWAEEPGEFGTGTLPTGLEDVCPTPGGGLVAVGWVEDRPRFSVPAAWSLVDGAWKRMDIGEIASLPGLASHCSEDAGGVVVAATVADRDALFRTVDGSAWSEVFLAGRGSAIGTPVEIPGGFAASGAWTDGSHSFPVVWLSQDGTRWSPVAISSAGPGRTSLVALDGADLLVMTNAVTAHPVSRIENIAAVVDEHAE